MGSRSFSNLNRLRLIFESTSTHQFLGTRSMHSGRFSRISLYPRIVKKGDPAISIVPEIEKWVQEGKKVQHYDLQRIIRDFRLRKRFGHALELSEWMGSKGVCACSAGYHAVRLDLISRVHGLDSAESYFNNLSDEKKTNKTYGALLNCYVREGLKDKSLSHMKKMKEMGFASALHYNGIMCLFANNGEYEKVPDVLAEMKEDGVPGDNYSYRICINSYGARSDINGMEQVLEEMEQQPHISMDWNTYVVVANFYIKGGFADKAVEFLKKAEEKLDKKDGHGYNHLISLYAGLGNKTEMLRLWKLKKDNLKKYINVDYSTMLSSLLKLDDIEAMEKLLEEWESSGCSYDFRVPNILLIGYCQKGMVEKAEEKLTDIAEKGKTPIPNSWGIISSGYLKMGEMEKAVECMNKALKLHVGNEGWRPNPITVSGILDWLADNGSVSDVTSFIENLKCVIPMDRTMYHALIKACIRGGEQGHEEQVDQLLQKMKASDIEQDEETQKVLSLRQA